MVADPADDSLDELREAAIWGMTIVLFDSWRRISQQTGVEPNRFYVDASLATPDSVTQGPNVETIYGIGWLDLGGGPQVLQVPDTDDRYYCVHLVDQFLQTCAYVGRRTTGTQAGTFLLAGPGWSGDPPKGMTLVSLPTDQLWMCPRMQVRDAQDTSDVAEARHLMGGLILGPLAQYPDGRRAPVIEDDATGSRFPTVDLEGMGAQFFDRLCELVRRPTGRERLDPTLGRPKSRRLPESGNRYGG